MVAARGDGSYQKMIVASFKTNLLILDGWGRENFHGSRAWICSKS
ncbi:hypothetical protein DFAR_3690066 [Desulfarculales bacterium]